MRAKRPGKTGMENAGSRVTLRPLSEDDLSELSRWCKANRPLEERLKEARADAVLGLLAITVAGEGEPVGVLQYRAGVPEDGWLGFGFVTVEPGLRGLGLDSDAVRLVEGDALERGVARRF